MKNFADKRYTFLRALYFTLFVCMFFFSASIVVFSAEDGKTTIKSDGRPTQLSIEDGNIFFGEQIRIEKTDGTITILAELDPDGYKIIGSSPENSIQIINNWHDPVDITLENMSASHLHITPEASVTMILSGENSFTHEGGSAIDHLGESLTINGTDNDSLLLSGTYVINSSGIGKSVIINGGNITCNAQNSGIIGTGKLTINDGNITINTENQDAVAISASEINGGTLNINGRIGSGFKLNGGTVNISCESTIRIFNQDAEITGGNVSISQLHPDGKIFDNADSNLTFTGGNIAVTNANQNDRILFPISLSNTNSEKIYHFANMSDALSAANQLSEFKLTINKNLTVNTDITLPGGATMEISDGVVLTLTDGVTFTNKGFVENSGTILGDIVCENHFGGKATCSTLAKCSLCSTEYGQPIPHPYSEKWTTDKNYHCHVCTYEDCDEVSDKGKHVYSNIFDVGCNICSYRRFPIAIVITIIVVLTLAYSLFLILKRKSKKKQL